MFDSDQYQLLDFGGGEKWESFGGIVVRRQTPSVGQRGRTRSSESKFRANHADPVPPISDLRYQIDGSRGAWTGSPPLQWQVQHGAKLFLLKPTPAGQLGIFPEQATNWEWIESLPGDLTGLMALNLFGYTGGTTMSLASRGVSVVHVDAAQNVMKWARTNAERTGLQQHPIRWIVEDAVKFVNREFQRGSKYDVLIADPPSFGRGPKNELWKFSEQIDGLLAGLASIAARNLRMLVLSCHSPGIDQQDLSRLAHRHFDLSHGKSSSFVLELKTIEQKRLASGHCFRFIADS